MGWLTYYKLLEKYNGDLTNATPAEMDDAAKSNPNTPPRALEIARQKYEFKNNKHPTGENLPYSSYRYIEPY